MSHEAQEVAGKTAVQFLYVQMAKILIIAASLINDAKTMEFSSPGVFCWLLLHCFILLIYTHLNRQTDM